MPLARGTRVKIAIWKDPWLPDNGNARVSSLPPEVENFPSADWVLRREDGLFVQACQKMMVGPRNPKLDEVVNLPEALI
ncbi:hypothetical protein GH714_011357 [Hevea brasiliensis]|uniref:Uncharacterized protein n=1 Tax=Hevea brasiliensis TaxID=3981 RepID=A0A6A6KIW8_HEVBR|nr:hypothetical protein GH714_011357 [Hevea brasiliensis]